MWYYANHNNIVPRDDHHLDFDEFQLKRNAHNTDANSRECIEFPKLTRYYIVILLLFVGFQMGFSVISFVAFGLKNNMTQNNIGDGVRVL